MTPSTQRQPNVAAMDFGPAHRAQCGALEMAGVVLVEVADGATRFSAQRLVAREVRVETPQGTADIALAVLTDVSVVWSSTGGVPALRELAAAEIRVEGMQAALNRMPPAPAAPVTPAPPMRLDALADLDGLVRAFITDALWFLDAEIVVPIAKGAIDFNRVEVEHIGPNSALGLGPSGIHVETPGQGRLDLVLFTTAPVPGATHATGGRLPLQDGDRGRLNLLQFLHALLEAPPGQAIARPADANLGGALRRTRVTGELHLGDGPLARDGHQVVLEGRAAGKNRVNISSPSLAQRMVIAIPALAASAATIGLPGRRVTAGSLAAAVEVQVLGDDARRDASGPVIVLAIAQATLSTVTVAPSSADAARA